METTPWGGRLDSGTGSIEIVIREMAIGQEFTETDVDREIVQRGLPNRKAKGNHFRHLRDQRYITRTKKGWQRVR